MCVSVLFVLCYVRDVSALCSTSCHVPIVSNSNYDQFGLVPRGGPQAPWRIPGSDWHVAPLHPYHQLFCLFKIACALAVWDQSEDYVQRFWNVTQAFMGPWVINFGATTFRPFDDAGDFTFPIYNASMATHTREVRWRTYPNNFLPSDRIPWNNAWLPSGGSDHQAIVLDEATGREWNLWMLDLALPGINCLNLLNMFDPNTMLCAGSARLIKDSAQVPVDFRTYEGSGLGARGVGISNSVMVLRVEEIEAGEIRHALCGGTFNTMFGPWCNATQMLDPTQAGRTCGFALRPAGAVEHASFASSAYNTFANSPYKDPALADMYRTTTTVPEGIRFVLNVTNEHVEAWLDAQGMTGARRRTFKIIVQALRDYGWMVTDTGGVAAIETEGNQLVDLRSRWQALGIAQGERFRLVGLLTSPQHLWVAAPPLDALGNPFFILNSPQADNFTHVCREAGDGQRAVPKPLQDNGLKVGLGVAGGLLLLGFAGLVYWRVKYANRGPLEVKLQTI
jgi:hypothetical protein